jgi:hypothetical protein
MIISREAEHYSAHTRSLPVCCVVAASPVGSGRRVRRSDRIGSVDETLATARDGRHRQRSASESATRLAVASQSTHFLFPPAACVCAGDVRRSGWDRVGPAHAGKHRMRTLPPPPHPQPHPRRSSSDALSCRVVSCRVASCRVVSCRIAACAAAACAGYGGHRRVRFGARICAAAHRIDFAVRTAYAARGMVWFGLVWLGYGCEQ